MISPYVTCLSWRSGYCYLNKGDCNLNQSKDYSFVERVARNNSWNNRDRHKIPAIFLINCFVFVITLVWKTVHSSAMTQIKAYLMKKNIATNCSQVTVHVLAGWTKKPFGHYAIMKLFSLRSLSGYLPCLCSHISDYIAWKLSAINDSI